jgi:glucose dehydrogenase
MRSAWIMILAGGAMLPALWAQAGKAPIAAADWPMYNRDLAGTRFSPLSQINGGNVAKLIPAWSYRFRQDANSSDAASVSELTPIVVNGVMYLSAGNRVLALEPETGKEIWRYELRTGLASRRGVAYWPGDRNNPPRILFNSLHEIVALNANTGKIDPGFGKEGAMPVDIPFAGVPTIYRNVILDGSNVYGPGEANLHMQDNVPGGVPGDSRAYDARTGKMLWTFHTIPRRGEVGASSWPEDAWKGRTGTNMWAITMTVDEQRGIAYMPIGGPAANYYGGDRKGDNLFSNSLVAVDAQTGKLKWYFQTVHHELWDYDLPPEPVLLDIVKDGKKIPAVAQTGKLGLMFILDRVTGKPVFGVEERPVPQGNVPGEWYSPTQPFPAKPPPLARLSFKREDMVTAEDTTPEHAKACQDLWEKAGGFDNQGPYTPWLFHAPGNTSRKATIIFPGFTGGINWGGTAADPNSGYIFLNTKDNAGTGWIQQNPKYGKEEGLLPYEGIVGGFSAPGKDQNGNAAGNWPCQKPPWARLIAVNANTGDIAWQTTLGIVEGLPESKRNAGANGSGGPIATAGGLVFIGATNDNRFRAFDSKTGKELWTTKLDYSVTAVPMTYQGKNGKQYVAVVAAGGGRGNNQSLVVFALP